VNDEHELHYSFPSARAYALNKLLYGIKSETPLRKRYLADPDGVMTELGLDAEDQAAMRSGARDALVARGAHPYLVFMADIRLRADRGQTTYEFF
jgi:hypothetical protein